LPSVEFCCARGHALLVTPLLIVLTVAELLVSQVVILCLLAVPEACLGLHQLLWLQTGAVCSVLSLQAANAGAVGCTWRTTRGTGLQQQEGNANSRSGRCSVLGITITAGKKQHWIYDGSTDTTDRVSMQLVGFVYRCTVSYSPRCTTPDTRGP
jgi:hypothetical protein